MGTQPVSTPLNADRLTQIIGTVAGLAAEIEGLIGASGAGGVFNGPQIEQLTLLFGNLAVVAIQAAHDALGRQMTPESLLALIPVGTVLSPPAK
jgi:hypothetical protein